MNIRTSSFSGLLSNYLVRSGALPDLEILAKIAEPLSKSTTTIGKSSFYYKGEGRHMYHIHMACNYSPNALKSLTTEPSELKSLSRGENQEEIFTPRLLATYFSDLSYEVEEELWRITRMKGKFKSRKHCSRLAICQERAFEMQLICI